MFSISRNYDIKNESSAREDGLVDALTTTEAENKDYKNKIDVLVADNEGFKKRIEELLGKISELEKQKDNLTDEIERRDQVVMKMAEKYQLVEKDEFNEDIVNDANKDTSEKKE